MGGIAGTFQQADGDHATRLMSERLAHRGPDGAGYHSYTDERASTHLAHRWLSVTRQETGQQPLVKDHLALTYDGELYNFRELREDLARGGAYFYGSSDTEVVLEAWRRWGLGCLRKMRGMFAFAIFDRHSGSLFLARDHLGVKPLHYIHRKDGVVFASELKALVAAYGHELDIEPSALISSMLYYWVPDSRCSLNGVQKLQPGTCIEFRPDGSSRTKTYFDAAEVAAAAAAGPPVDLRDVIEHSVASQVRAGTPMSSLLSGGLDSSIVTVLAQRYNPNTDAYTIRFRPQDKRMEAMPDDTQYARKVARHFGINLREIEIAPDVAALLPRLVDILDEPIGDPAAINTLLVCEAARNAGVKVLLSGMGADELFGGYRKHLACLMAERYQHLPPIARRAASSVVGHMPVAVGGRGLRYARWAKRFLSFAELPEEAAFRRSYSLYDPSELAELLSPELVPDIGDILGEHFEIYSDNSLTDRVNRMCLTDARLYLPGLNLAYTDRASVAASTEVRLPFVDPVVFRAAFALPGSEKIAGRRPKAALKEAAREWLPPEIVERPKVSFSAPLRAWVSRDLREMVDDMLCHGDLVGTGFVREDALSSLVADDRAGRRDNSKQIWQLLTLELWYRQASRAGVSL